MKTSRRTYLVRLLPTVAGFVGIVLVLGLAFRAILPASATMTDLSVTSRDWYSPGGWAPWGTAFDQSGNVWLALPGCDPSPMCGSSTPPGKIAVFNPHFGAWPHLYQLPAGFGQALFLAIDPAGRVWFPMPMSNSLGMFDPSSETFQQWPVPTAASGPWGIAIDHQGGIWFTEHYGNKIGHFDPSSQTFTEISTPALNSQPYGITVDSANAVWFTENNDSVAQIGEYAAGSLSEYRIRNGSTAGSGLTPHQITVDPQGNIWWSEGWVHMIGKLQVSLAQPGTSTGVTEFGYTPPCSICGAHTSGIGADSNGQIWFDDSLQSIIGAFPQSGSGSFSLFGTPTPGSHPHDGLNVDASNTIWFDEEFGNKLAQTIQGNASPTPMASPAISPTPTLTPTPTATLTPTATPIASVTPGTVLAQDTFQRANQSFWGAASDGHTWAADASTNKVFSISGNSGRVTNGSGNYSAVLGASSSNVDEVFSGSLSVFNNTNIGAVLRWSDSNNWYKAYLDGKTLVLQKKVNGVTTTLASTAFVAGAGSSYSLRFDATGTTLSARVWATGTTEPAGWMVTSSDSTFTSGYCGLRLLVQNGATATVTAFTANAL